MKVAYKHIVQHIPCRPSILDISQKFFQLGHEHDIQNEIFDMEITPNRGDCLSINGILRELAVFYDLNIHQDKYENEIPNFDFKFNNNAQSDCPHISFLKIDIENTNINKYQGELKNYFNDLNHNKNNFFTDISNYLLYETGQPTHCYDALKINEDLSISRVNGNYDFETLTDKKIVLSDENLVFLDGKKIINLAGVMGSKDTACSKQTTSVIVECAYFNPEKIIGTTLKYGVPSEAAYRFERNTDPKCHEYVLRRFIQIVSDHAKIKDIKLFTEDYNQFQQICIPLNENLVNKIIGIELSQEEYINYLQKLGFSILDNIIKVPSYRNDVTTHNDLAEEIARIIGYDNIPSIEINAIKKFNDTSPNIEQKLKNLFIDNGFYEVINNPFVKKTKVNSIKLDNPLDSNKGFIRESLKNSLLENLLYNERRQKDSIKLFEVSDIYTISKSIKSKKVIGVIASGRLSKNYKDFSKKISSDYLVSILKDYVTDKNEMEVVNIPRDSLNSKLKTPISYLEIELDKIDLKIRNYKELSNRPEDFIKYIPISNFPSSSRDLSFSIKEYTQSEILESFMLNYKNSLLREVFIFDFYENEKENEIKIGFRLVFQSQSHTVNDSEIDNVINDIILGALKIKSVTLPGFMQE